MHLVQQQSTGREREDGCRTRNNGNRNRREYSLRTRSGRPFRVNYQMASHLKAAAASERAVFFRALPLLYYCLDLNGSHTAVLSPSMKASKSARSKHILQNASDILELARNLAPVIPVPILCSIFITAKGIVDISLVRFLICYLLMGQSCCCVAEDARRQAGGGRACRVCCHSDTRCAFDNTGQGEYDRQGFESVINTA